jgi:KDO2-lipid IV(A) lauroyltransferase
MWLGLGLLRLAAWLPHHHLLAIGRALGLLVWHVFPYRRGVAATNLRLCYPGMPPAQRRARLRAHYAAMGMGVFELAEAWWKPAARLRGLADIHGIEHLRAVAASGRGAILLSGHFTTLEIIGRLLNDQYRFSCLYRRPNNPVLSWVMSRRRAQEMAQVIHFDDMPGFIRALRHGAMVWYAPDQGKSFKYAVVAPFFGEPAISNAATGRIAAMGSAAILPFFGRRLENGRYRIDILPEITDLPSADPVAEASHINELIAARINLAPEQYFWLHRRFKRRGPEYPDVYSTRATG